MKTARILPLLAAMLLVGCSGTTPTPASQGPISQEPESVESAPKVVSKMTSIDLGKMYLEINLSKKSNDFKIKVGGQEITNTTTITMSSTMEFTVEGTLNNVCFYRAIETPEPIAWSAGRAENVDEEAANNFLARYLKKIVSTQSGARVYFCITDTVGGWNKTMPGVDWVINAYAPSF